MSTRKTESDDDSSYRSEEGSDFEIEVEDLRKEKTHKEKKVGVCGASKGKKPAEAPATTSSSSSKNVKPSAPRSRKRKPEEKLFDNLESTLDISDSVASCKRVKVSSSLMIESRMVDVKDEDTKRMFSYPAIVFLRRLKDGKIFEFNIPASLASKVVEAVTVVALK